MRRIEQSFVRFRADEGGELIITHTNRGEPYREGIELSFDFDIDGGCYDGRLFLENYEAKQLRDLLNRLYPQNTSENEHNI